MHATLPDPQERAAAAVLGALARGELSAPVALARLLAVEPWPDALRARLAERPGADALVALLDRHAAGAVGAAAVLRLASEDGPRDLAACARLFDRAVEASPEAAVAAYSLGDAGLLDEATAELVALLDRLGVLGPARRVLDVGCGIGRLERALAARVGAVTGVDVSAGMIREARARCAGLANVTLLRTSGRDLRALPDGSFDAALAVDAFPYLFQAGGPGLAGALVAEAARVLRPRGDLVVLNLSYRGDPGLDRADAAAMARAAGFELLRDGTADLELWDGRTFHFRLPAA